MAFLYIFKKNKQGQSYQSEKIEKSRRIADSRPVCMSTLSGYITLTASL